MSVLMRIAPSVKLAAVPVRKTAAATLRPACFSTAARQEKGPIEVTKETLKKADRVVSDAAVKGIETGQKATHKIKDTFDAATGKAGSYAKKGTKDVEYKTRDLADETKEEADEWTGKA